MDTRIQITFKNAFSKSMLFETNSNWITVISSTMQKARTIFSKK